jgi:glycosyltransferase involved in cell wall biosynthesis
MLTHVLHVIADLDVGGAETTLTRLVASLPRDEWRSTVVTMLSGGAHTSDISARGIPVHSLGMSAGKPDVSQIARLARLMRRSAPDIVQTWMYHADLLGGLAARLAGYPRVVWNIRHAGPACALDKRLTRWTAKTCAILSSFIPARILCNSDSARQLHVQAGYADSKMLVIPNGVDTDLFRPDADARAAVRDELGVPPDAAVVAMVARYHPCKDHMTFMRAAAAVRRTVSDVKFVLCGLGSSWENKELREFAEREGLRDAVRLIGPRSDVHRVLAASDVVCSSSVAEAFPNVVAQAMACGVPCVATDVGDSARIVGDTGLVVPPRQPARLSHALTTVLEMDTGARAMLGRQARIRITEIFGIEAMTKSYEKLYRGLVR